MASLMKRERNSIMQRFGIQKIAVAIVAIALAGSADQASAADMAQAGFAYGGWGGPAMVGGYGGYGGFGGPGYYARHSDVFVGYAYNYSGPWTVAPRLPVGVVVSLGRAEAYVEALIEIPMLPSPQVLVGGGIGVRVSL